MVNGIILDQYISRVLKLKVCYWSVRQGAVAWRMMEGTVGSKYPHKRSMRKASWSQTEDVGKKKSAELSIKAATVSCERMQLYSILTKGTIPTLVAKASTPHSLKWRHILTVDHLGTSSPLASIYWNHQIPLLVAYFTQCVCMGFTKCSTFSLYIYIMYSWWSSWSL